MAHRAEGMGQRAWRGGHGEESGGCRDREHGAEGKEHSAERMGRRAEGREHGAEDRGQRIPREGSVIAYGIELELCGGHNALRNEIKFEGALPLINAMPYAPRSMRCDLCPMPHALCSMHYALCPMRFALFPAGSHSIVTR